MIAKSGRVLTPHGEPYDSGSIAAALTLRNLMDTLRSSGVETGDSRVYWWLPDTSPKDKMNLELSLLETRVIGCLMEKEIATPEQYPLSMNALTNACNQ